MARIRLSLRFGAPLALAGLVVAFVVFGPDTTRKVDASTTADGLSHVKSVPTTPEGVVLRSCPHLPNAGTSTNYCGPLERMPDGTAVQMLCWKDDAAPDSEDPALTSPRWFYVIDRDVDVGQAGWVHSSQVPEDEQVSTPFCTDEILDAHPINDDPPLPPVEFSVTGSCTSDGGTLHAWSRGFTPGGDYDNAAAYPDGSPYDQLHSPGTVNDDGTVQWEWPCAGDLPGEYTAWLVDLSTGRDTGPVTFTIGPPPVPEPAPVVVRSGPPSTPSTPTPPPSSTTTTAPPAPPPSTTTTTAPPPPPATFGYSISDSYLHGTWARNDPDDGTWFHQDRQPANGRAWLPDGQAISVLCAQSAATYRVRFPDRYENWSWWVKLADGSWVPTATLSEAPSTDGNPGIPAC